MGLAWVGWVVGLAGLAGWVGWLDKDVIGWSCNWQMAPIGWLATGPAYIRRSLLTRDHKVANGFDRLAGNCSGIYPPAPARQGPPGHMGCPPAPAWQGPPGRMGCPPAPAWQGPPGRMGYSSMQRWGDAHRHTPTHTHTHIHLTCYTPTLTHMFKV